MISRYRILCLSRSQLCSNDTFLFRKVRTRRVDRFPPHPIRIWCIWRCLGRIFRCVYISHIGWSWRSRSFRSCRTLCTTFYLLRSDIPLEYMENKTRFFQNCPCNLLDSSNKPWHRLHHHDILLLRNHRIHLFQKWHHLLFFLSFLADIQCMYCLNWRLRLWNRSLPCN